MPERDLIAPIEVHALVVNRAVRSDQEVFSRWSLNFTAMLDADDKPPAEPPVGSGDGAPDRGVYVAWQLPEALASGLYDPDSGEVSFPLVPNRWLVVRAYTVPSGMPDEGQRRSAAWVVHSDYLRRTHGGPHRGTVQYLVRNADGALMADQIGRAHDLRTGPWREPAEQALFLTAVGPGVPAFAAFQPYNQNVFSFHDTLDDLRDEQAWPDYPGPSTLSYLVTGWYSADPGDILVTAPTVPGLLPPDPADSLPPGEKPSLPDEVRLLRRTLAALRWALPGLSDLPEDGDGSGAPLPERSVYAGTALGIRWNYTDAEAPDSARPGHESQTVAFGHSTADALDALVSYQTGSRQTGRLLAALYHGTIDALDAPDGEIDFEEATRHAWFSSQAGGHTWLVVPRGSHDDQPPRTAPVQPEWLNKLSADQVAYDTAAIELGDAQARLRVLWWLLGLENPTFDRAAAEAEFDTATPGTLAYRADQAARTMHRLVTEENLPNAGTPAELAEQIAEYARDHQLPETLRLSRIPLGEYHAPADPAMVIAGGGVTQPLTRGAALPCRTPTNLVTAIAVNGTPVSPVPPPLVPPGGGTAPIDLTGLPEPVAGLLREYAALDHAAITTDIAADRPALEIALADRTLVTGTVPEYTGMWRQPWLPMYLEWDLRYHTIPYRDGHGEHHWEVNDDGDEYKWLGTGADPGDGIDGPTWLPYAARTLVTPSIPYVAAEQIDRLRRTYGVTEDPALRALAEDYREQDLLAQTIEGFNDHLLMRDTGVRAVLPAEITALTGDVAHVPAPGNGGDPESRFQPLRAGQLYVRDLRIIDRFGRCLVITNVADDRYLKFRPRLSLSVTPSATLHPNNPGRFIQLPPRLLHAARVGFEAERGTDDGVLPLGRATPAGVDSPFTGWLLFNHLDQTLMVYAPDGDPIGELRVIRTEDGGERTAFTPLPGSPYRAEDDPAFAERHRHLAEFVGGVVGPTGPYRALTATIDHALDTIVTPGGEDDRTPATLVGRPVALYRARLELRLRGHQLSNPGWDHALDPDPTDPYPTYRWPIRLGNPDQLADGLIGYYASQTGPGGATDYTRLYVTSPVSEDPYLAKIGEGEGLALPARPPGQDEETHHVTVLADPHVPVHATTRILPVAALSLPSDLVHQALRRIRAAFRLNPLLAHVALRPPDGDRDGDAGAGEQLVIVRPAAHHGAWTWAQPRSADDAGLTWDTLPLLASDDRADPDTERPHVRAGYLLLSPVDEEGF